MRYRELGRTGIQLSELGFGVWTLSTGWWGTYSDDEAVALLRAAYSRGVTFFDSADSYGNGRSEELLAKAFEGQRDQIVIGTKFGYDFYTNGGERNGQRELPQAWSPAFVRTALEQSLRRLGTDYVDVYQLHNPKMDAMDNDALWATLEDLRREGTIRSFGPALGPAIGWQKEGEKALLTRNCDVLHQIYNVLEQDPGRALADLAKEDVPADVSEAYGNIPLAFGPEYILPKPLDSRVLLRAAPAVAEAAMKSGLAHRQIDLQAYLGMLEARMR